MDYKETEMINRRKILKVMPEVTDESGIYILFRADENGLKYGYVGQAKHVLSRLTQHLGGYEQHIDLSLRKHGLYDVTDNPLGWRIACVYCQEDALDDMERQYILSMASKGYQLRNKTAGGQDKGKYGIDGNKPSRGYYDGKKQGYEDARKLVSHWFELHLDVTIKGKSNKNKEKALARFQEFLRGDISE